MYLIVTAVVAVDMPPSAGQCFPSFGFVSCIIHRRQTPSSADCRYIRGWRPSTPRSLRHRCYTSCGALPFGLPVLGSMGVSVCANNCWSTAAGRFGFPKGECTSHVDESPRSNSSFKSILFESNALTRQRRKCAQRSVQACREE
ncbi:hypothetical protein T440DRAFT_36257 [Plenodomus tracheiphilus IPT5]|uniref:Uncharacterized protein n=1 Tax=Plenodomus tracheiphilus IPT5 TaxID=1408161 RepID=A0A6A7B9R1_9PLEO|nr:hypothetical protein T440DRAFT_36257 [Plenodomus tracheiphilus IPT5]